MWNMVEMSKSSGTQSPEENSHPEKKTRYRVEINWVQGYFEGVWQYTVFLGDSPRVLWCDSTFSKWGAQFAAKRALRKLRKGKDQHEPLVPFVRYYD